MRVLIVNCETVYHISETLKYQQMIVHCNTLLVKHNNINRK